MSKTLKITGSQWGFVAVIALMAVTLYMAFAFPTGFFHLKQSETTELKSVIIVSRNGDQSPSSESFFIGEEPPEDLYTYGYDQLTNVSTFPNYAVSRLPIVLKLTSVPIIGPADRQESHVHARQVPQDALLRQALGRESP